MINNHTFKCCVHPLNTSCTDTVSRVDTGYRATAVKSLAVSTFMYCVSFVLSHAQTHTQTHIY